LKDKIQIHVLPITRTFHPINKIFSLNKAQFHTISNSSGKGINAKTSAASEFSDNFSLHLATHHYIRKSFIDRLIKPEKCCVETKWFIDKWL
jgi:hypothetical protein